MHRVPWQMGLEGKQGGQYNGESREGFQQEVTHRIWFQIFRQPNQDECLNLGNVQKDKKKGADLRKMLKAE